ncbi:alkene reductase [Streptomyces sp. AK02-01A]|uniref:alkene reductase n=1 Tax=Streptomyces sp. AK02-01A TaxID=3028648 RepID=UPI0029B73B22|nr:alkene reductase [Streptomyces sp. AK02-01A]MDX3853960.1 alkene reductase [Streptomyces sp. AK02-01A]
MTNQSRNLSQPLLRPVRLGALELPNRVVMAPMTRARAHNADLAPTELQATYYAQRAGAGLIISEGTWVNDEAIGFINVPGIYSDAQTAGWTVVTEAVHAAGGRIVSQLGHVGSVSHPDHFGGRLPAGPSAVNPGEKSFAPSGMKDTVTPRAFTAAEIGDTLAGYRTAAVNARRAGFDGLEIHAQGPQLIGQFLNPRLNKRTDAYGGSPERRAQFLLDVLDAVNGVWDSPRVGVKISPYWTSGAAFTADEETLTDYDQLIKKLGGGGLAYLHLMGPTAVAGTAEERLAPFARYRALYDGPIVANVGFTQDTGNEIIENGVADAVSFGAPFIANPDLVERFAEGHPLAEADRATIYAGHTEGYTDYPAATPAAK